MLCRYGFDGRSCLLRAICELADTPLVHHGLWGKLIDLIFRYYKRVFSDCNNPLNYYNN